MVCAYWIPHTAQQSNVYHTLNTFELEKEAMDPTFKMKYLWPKKLNKTVAHFYRHPV